MAIDKIVSTDVTRSILNFLPYDKGTKRVNNPFNLFVQQNVELVQRQRKLMIASQFKSTNTWLVDETRSSLDAHEIQQGILGPIKSLKEALYKMDSGDKLLLADDFHKIETCDLYVSLTGMHILKDVQIEGLGDNCIIEAPGCSPIHLHGKVSICNVKCGGFELDWHSKLWLTDCDVTASMGVTLGDDAQLDCVNVRFRGVSARDSSSAIWTRASRGPNCPNTVSVVDCTFVCWGSGSSGLLNSCLQLDNEPTLANLKLKLTGNTFMNCGKYPIGTKNQRRSEKPKLHRSRTVDSNVVMASISATIKRNTLRSFIDWIDDDEPLESKTVLDIVF